MPLPFLSSLIAAGSGLRDDESGPISSLLNAASRFRPDVGLRMRAESITGKPLEEQEFGPLMKTAGDIRPNDPELGSYIDRFAQGKNVAGQPGFGYQDIPVNAALATGYEGVKALPESLGNPLLSAVGYNRTKTGQKTAPASLGNVYGLISGMLSR